MSSRAGLARLGGLPLPLLDGFDLEVELDLLADDQAAGLEDLVPVHAPLLAVDLAGGGKAMRWPPHGSPRAPSNVTSSVTRLVTPLRVRSPSTVQFVPEPVTRVPRNDTVGWFGTSKKTFVRRCSSRFGSRVSIDATSTLTVTFDSSGRSAISMTPSKALKRPRTLARPRWRTANSTAEWEADEEQSGADTDVPISRLVVLVPSAPSAEGAPFGQSVRCEE
jgi:hypothetical protein